MPPQRLRGGLNAVHYCPCDDDDHDEKRKKTKPLLVIPSSGKTALGITVPIGPPNIRSKI